MKIGFKADNYSNDVYIEISNSDEDRLFLGELISRLKSGNKKDFDQLIDVIDKKEQEKETA